MLPKVAGKGRRLRNEPTLATSAECCEDALPPGDANVDGNGVAAESEVGGSTCVVPALRSCWTA